MTRTAVLFLVCVGCSLPATRRPAPVDEVAGVVLNCPQPLRHYGEARVEARLATAASVPDGRAAVVAMLRTTYPRPQPLASNGSVLVYRRAERGDSTVVGSMATDAVGRVVVDLDSNFAVTVLGRAVGYEPISYPFRARVGFADTLVFYLRVEVHRECES